MPGAARAFASRGGVAEGCGEQLAEQAAQPT
jgi:hypothetical protein